MLPPPLWGRAGVGGRERGLTLHPNPPPQGGREPDRSNRLCSLPPCGGGPGWGVESVALPPTLTLPHKGGGNQTGATGYAPSPLVGEGRGGGSRAWPYPPP